MLLRTHLVITLIGIAIFLSHINNKFVFVIVALLTTFIPDVDSAFSTLGRKSIFRPLQFFLEHRGLLHSFTFLVLATFFFVLFIPVVAFPFFLAYSLHLFADSFTVDGIKPIYPNKYTIKGKIKTGGLFETGLFIGLVLAFIILVLFQFGFF